MDVDFVRYKYEHGYDGVITKTKFKFGVRHVQMVYMILSALVMGMMRSSTTIAILAVADTTRVNETYIQIHNWDRKIQGTILSSFFFGYAAALVPADLYLKYVGDKLIFAAILLINGGISSAMPTIINKGGWLAASNAQLLLGMTQGCMSPVNYSLMSSWFLPCEKKLFGYFIHSAIILGVIIAFPIAGLLTEARLGWELVFYAQAMMTLSMAAMWVLLTASNPNKHEAVGDTEKEMIREALSRYREKKLVKPWGRIIKSSSFWALASAHVAANTVFVFFLSEIPAFLQTHNKSLRIVSLQAALPIAAMWVAYSMTSPAIEYIHHICQYSLIFDTKHFRKIINGLGALGIIIGLAILPHLSHNWPELALTVLSGVLALIGFQFSGFLENYRDMTENFAGTLLMMTSVVASIAASTVPFLIGLTIGDNETSPSNWNTVFSTLSCFYFACSLVYLSFSSSDRQAWDSSNKPKIGYNNDAANLEMDEIQTKVLDHEMECDI